VNDPQAGVREVSDPEVSDPLLSVRNLRTAFEIDGVTLPAVDGVSFDVRSGETLGLVGESGCGKTVTSLAILRLLPRSARIGRTSSVRFRGEELVTATEKRMRALRGNEISMIFQEPMSSLNPVYTIGDQITEGLRTHLGVGRAAARAEAVRLLAEVGMRDPEDRLEQHPHQLSGGMRQRVMIAIALACEPALLIADEPTTALDVTIQAQILALLAEIRARRSMAVLLITHDLGVVAEVCDRVVVMYAGQVVETGSVEEIFADPRHPYTRGLLDALPSLDRPDRRLVAIPGTVPGVGEWSAGCRFQERCPLAGVGCEVPQDLVPLPGADRAARCWRVEPAKAPARSAP
jgi:peptide/nickel transport system ATP-binding protein